MPDFPLYQGCRLYHLGGTTSSKGTVITAGSANTKGSWTEIASSLPSGIVGFYLGCQANSHKSYLVDVGIGSAGNEVVVLENVFSNAHDSGGFHVVYFPIALPEGQRLAARCQCLTGSATVAVSLICIQGAFPSPAGLAKGTSYGADTANSKGTAIDPGGTANTKGSWTQLVASTGEDIRALVVMAGTNVQAGDITAANGWLLDIGVGAASSEQVVVPDLYYVSNSSADEFQIQNYGPFPVAIPAGTRIAARAQCAITDATFRVLSVALIGLR